MMQRERDFLEEYVWGSKKMSMEVEGKRIFRYFDIMKYLAQIGRCFVRNLRHQSKNDFNIDQFSGWIDEGLFGTP